MFSIRFRLPGAGIGILVIVIVFTVALLRLGYSPEMTLVLVAGAIGAAIKAARYLGSRPKEA
jgi:hypothetical protein